MGKLWIRISHVQVQFAFILHCEKKWYVKSISLWQQIHIFGHMLSKSYQISVRDLYQVADLEGWGRPDWSKQFCDSITDQHFVQMNNYYSAIEYK